MLTLLLLLLKHALLFGSAGSMKLLQRRVMGRLKAALRSRRHEQQRTRTLASAAGARPVVTAQPLAPAAAVRPIPQTATLTGLFDALSSLQSQLQQRAVEIDRVAESYRNSPLSARAQQQQQQQPQQPLQLSISTPQVQQQQQLQQIQPLSEAIAAAALALYRHSCAVAAATAAAACRREAQEHNRTTGCSVWIRSIGSWVTCLTDVQYAGSVLRGCCCAERTRTKALREERSAARRKLLR